MKNLLDSAPRAEVIDRIRMLSSESSAQWGKMDVHRMVRHCIIWDEWVQGTNSPVYRQEFLGRLFGKMALKSNVKDDRPLKRGMPAGRGFAVKEVDGVDLEVRKKEWIALVEGYASFSNDAFLHDFFGKMTTDQIGIFAYKHADHHLRQFGV